MNIPTSFAGNHIRRLEDPEFVQGTARFVGVSQLPGTLSVIFVRCPLGHARVRSLSLDAVRKMPGVVATLGPHDLAVLAKPMQPMNRDPGIEERTPRPLADEVRYAGDAVAAVVADDPYRAADKGWSEGTPC